MTISALSTRLLASTLAELSGNFDRYDGRGSPIGRFGFTYLLRQVSDDWKIAVAVAHDPNDAPARS